MASETITRNDLTAILNEVLPPTPSEYKKLLWTNPSPGADFAAQTMGLNLSDYDEVEIVATFLGDIVNSYSVRCAVGAGSNLAYQMLNTSTATNASTFINGVAREFSVSTSGITFGNGQMTYNGNAYTNWASRAIPYKIYGIKYERVNPPQISGWDYITSVTGSNTVTFTDLATQGYSEVYVKDSAGYGGGYSPVVALPTALTWGGYYSGVNGLLHGVDITTTSIKGRYGMTDSTNYLASMTFYLYAR